MRRLMIVLGLSLLAGCASEPPRKYLVFFTNSSAELDDAARNVIQEASDLAQKHSSRVVQVEGYATAGNDLSADSLLATQRAKLVAQQLQNDGVPGDRIRQTPRAPSNTEGSSVGSRRVEIELVSP